MAGGDRTDIQHGRGRPTPFNSGPTLGNSPASPPGENKRFIKSKSGSRTFSRSGDGNPSRGQQSELTAGGGMVAGEAPDDEIENQAAEAGLPEEDDLVEPETDFLQLVREAEAQSSRYLNQMNLKSWSQAMRAFHQQHYAGSKYTKGDWRNRSKFFRPKTRSAVRKDMAAVAASMFNNVDAVNCLPGNEGDPKQRAGAAVMEELVNYRTDRSSGRAAIPWFQVAMGARQDSLLTGICISKQSWKMELKKSKAKPEFGELTLNEETGVHEQSQHDVYEPVVDRPDCQLIPPENIIIDPAADWTNAIQSAQYVIIKWPMTMEEIRRQQKSPLNPWKVVDESVLRASTDVGTFNSAAIRRAREMDADRLNEAQTGVNFQVVWVYECYIRIDDEDWTFISVGDQAYLTEPRPVEEVYPEQYGERPLVMGYGSLEAHRLYPMSPVESWQMAQLELNDIVNLSLDAIKQNVMPVSKVVRGKNIDLDQVKRRSSGSSIIVANKDDVTWDRPPDIPQSVPIMTRELELEFDDLAGQFNGQTAENSNSLSRTLGGLKLVAGSANAVQEYDIRVWIETWASPVLSQIVRLEQYYEADPVVLGLCGERAQLFDKHGVSEIDDHLLEQEVTVRVSVGLGAGDPQQRLQKFAMATQIAMPLLMHSKEFMSGQYTIDTDAVMQEIYGAAGYRDGGARFIKKGQPQQDPMADLNQQKIKSEIEKNNRQGRASLLTGLAAVAKVALGDKQLEADQTNQLIDHTLQARDMGHQHGHAHLDRQAAERQQGHEHGMAIAQHRQGVADGNRDHAFKQAESDRSQQNADRDFKLNAATAAAPAAGGSGGGEAPAMLAEAAGGGESSPPSQHVAETPTAPEPAPQMAAPPPAPAPAPRPLRYDFVRDPNQNNRIVSAVPVYSDEPPAAVAAQKQQAAPGGTSAPAPQPPALPPFARPVNRGRRPGQEVPLPPASVRGAA